MPKSRAPTAGDIMALYRLRKNDQGENRLRVLAHNFRILTQMDQVIEIPAQYKATTKEVRTPFVRDAWLRTTASLTINPALVHIEPISQARDAKRAANIGEEWLRAGFQSMSADVGQDVVYEAVKGLVRDAESVIKIVDRREAWANFPRRAGDDEPDAYRKKIEEFKKGAPFPFAWRSVDRLQMVFGDGEFGDDWALEYGVYPRPYLASRYGMAYDREADRLKTRATKDVTGVQEGDYPVTPATLLGGTPRPESYTTSNTTGQAVKIEFWNADWWCVVIDGRYAPGFPKENPYSPWLPYARARPDQDAEPVLYSLLFLAPRLDELLTMWMNWAYLGAYPNPYLEDVPNSNALPGALEPPLGDDNQPSTFTWTPGKFLEIPRGKRFAFMQPPPVGADVRQMSDLLRGLIDIAGIPSILRGSTLSGDSGYLANQMIAAATMMYKRLGLATQRQLEYAGRMMFSLVDKVFDGQTVFVLGQGTEGKAWLGVRSDGETTETIATTGKMGPLSVSLRPILPTMDQANALIARQLTDGDRPLDSRQHAMEHWLGYENPDKILDEIWVERAMEAPPLNDLILNDALRQAGLPIPGEVPATNPAAALVGPNGQPLMPGIPAEMSGGMPVAPGMGMPVSPPNGVVGAPGGRPAGMYPGAPPNAPAV